jgi:hypothetical protein
MDGRMQPLSHRIWICKLNEAATALIVPDPDEEIIDTQPATTACLAAAQNAGLVLVASDADEEPQEYERRIYRTPDGVLVNLWMDGPDGEQGTRLGDGAVGFDDQTEWYEEAE